MRAWIFTSLALLATAFACGGTTDSNIDGGDDSGNGGDVVLGNDTGPGPDGGLVDVVDELFLDAPSEAAGPFDPSQLGTNLVLWLEGDKGVTQTTNVVSTWADQTNYHNDANGGSGQGAHQPTYDATAINNLPAVEFAIPQQFQTPSQYLTIPDSASLQLGAGDFAIFMVAEYTNSIQAQGGSQGAFYYKVAGTNTPTGPELLGNSGSGTNNSLESRVRARLTATDNVNSAATGFNDGKYHRIGMRRNGAALEVWADGVVTSFTPDAGAPGDVSATGSDVSIGAAVGGNFPQFRLAGGIAEVIVVKGTISDGDVSGLDGYFKSKYALP